ncbi:MAG: hypothetical protein LBQ86_00175, partial [Holophagales bacterium]|nr:hypothetical protein [Holophagales bacterium]
MSKRAMLLGNSISAALERFSKTTPMRVLSLSSWAVKPAQTSAAKHKTAVFKQELRLSMDSPFHTLLQIGMEPPDSLKNQSPTQCEGVKGFNSNSK